MLGNRRRLERPQAVALHLHFNLSDLGRHRLRIRSVAVVARAATISPVGFMPELLSQLDVQRYATRHQPPRPHSARSHECDPFRQGPVSRGRSATPLTQNSDSPRLGLCEFRSISRVLVRLGETPSTESKRCLDVVGILPDKPSRIALSEGIRKFGVPAVLV